MSIIFKEGWEEAAVDSLSNEIANDFPKFSKQYKSESGQPDKVPLSRYIEVEAKPSYYFMTLHFDVFVADRLGKLNGKQSDAILGGIKKKLNLETFINTRRDKGPYNEIYIASACNGCPYFLCYKTNK